MELRKCRKKVIESWEGGNKRGGSPAAKRQLQKLGKCFRDADADCRQSNWQQEKNEECKSQFHAEWLAAPQMLSAAGHRPTNPRISASTGQNFEDIFQVKTTFHSHWNVKELKNNVNRKLPARLCVPSYLGACQVSSSSAKVSAVFCHFVNRSHHHPSSPPDHVTCHGYPQDITLSAVLKLSNLLS